MPIHENLPDLADTTEWELAGMNPVGRIGIQSLIWVVGPYPAEAIQA